MKFFPIYFILFSILLFSCKTKNKVDQLNYLQDIETVAIQTIENNTLNILQPGDQLAIFVSAKNMEVVTPFNQTYYGTATKPTVSERTYIVDTSGNIDFPLVGNISIQGKTVEQVKEVITSEVTQYVKNPTVTVKHLNFKVSILGEVGRPNQYMLPEGKFSVLNAIAMAGDITIHGKREEVIIIRNEGGQIINHKLNLLASDYMNSPYFYLKQGDVIIVPTNETKQKIAKQNPNTSLYIAVAGMVIGLAGIFVTVFRQ